LNVKFHVEGNAKCKQGTRNKEFLMLNNELQKIDK
jgi:hypothetical protein